MRAGAARASSAAPHAPARMTTRCVSRRTSPPARRSAGCRRPGTGRRTCSPRACQPQGFAAGELTRRARADAAPRATQQRAGGSDARPARPATAGGRWQRQHAPGQREREVVAQQVRLGEPHAAALGTASTPPSVTGSVASLGSRSLWEGRTWLSTAFAAAFQPGRERINPSVSVRRCGFPIGFRGESRLRVFHASGRRAAAHLAAPWPGCARRARTRALGRAPPRGTQALRRGGASNRRRSAFRPTRGRGSPAAKAVESRVESRIDARKRWD